MIQYEFQLDLNSAKTKKSIISIISNQQGIEFQGSVRSSWVPSTRVAYLNGSVSLYNLDFHFNEYLSFGDQGILSYRTNWRKEWRTLMQGVISTPQDSDQENGDFLVSLELFQVSRNAFFKRELKNDKGQPRDFKGKTIGDALKEVLDKRLTTIYVDPARLNKKIEGSFTPYNIEEFLSRIQNLGGFSIRTNHDSEIYSLEEETTFCVYEREEAKKSIVLSRSKALEDYGLFFLPQASVETNTNTGVCYITYQAKTLLTRSLNVGDTVSFENRLGKKEIALVEEISHSFSPRGECSTTLSLLDQNSYQMRIYS